MLQTSFIPLTDAIRTALAKLLDERRTCASTPILHVVALAHPSLEVDFDVWMASDHGSPLVGRAIERHN